MSFRFQRRVRLFPGARVNFSKRGVSLTGGQRGASLTAGRRGLYSNLGLPGTGLSKRTRLGQSGRKPSEGTRTDRSDGERTTDIVIRWEPGQPDPVVVAQATELPVPADLKAAVLKNNRAAIIELGLRQVQMNNERLEEAVNIHRQSLAPDSCIFRPIVNTQSGST